MGVYLWIVEIFFLESIYVMSIGSLESCTGATAEYQNFNLVKFASFNDIFGSLDIDSVILIFWIIRANQTTDMVNEIDVFGYI